MIVRLTSGQANAMLRNSHYLGGLEYPPTYCLAPDEQNAVAVFSPPIAQHFKVKLPRSLELTRLWQSQCRRDTGARLSDFLREALKWLRWEDCEIPCVFSYTDPGQRGPNGKPHNGQVYQWTGFSKLGQSRVTDYWITRDLLGNAQRISAPKMYRMHKTKSREKLRAMGYELEDRPGKILYVYGLQKSVSEVRKIIGGRYKIPASEPVEGAGPSAAKPQIEVD